MIGKYNLTVSKNKWETKLECFFGGKETQDVGKLKSLIVAWMLENSRYGL